MKAILISDHAKWCALMMNGKKKVEVRKGTALYKATQKLIDEYGYADIYVCCVKGNEDIVRESSPYSSVPNYVCVKFDKKLSKDLPEYEYSSRGKVIFKFRCYKVEEIKLPYTKFNSTEWVGCEEERKWQTPTMNEDKLLELSCLEELELYGYLNGKPSTAIHISDLEVFDKPKELSEFYHYVKYNKEMATLNNQDWDFCKLTKAPQSWCYIEGKSSKK